MRKKRGKTSLKIYGNCLMLSPEGEQMFRCTQKRADWYIQRGLAKKESDSPLAFRLCFSPKGRGEWGDVYSLSERANLCVVCGSPDRLTRHHVLPYCYKVHLPEKMRSHKSYDVLPLCLTCHRRYESHAEKFKRSQFADNGIEIVLPKSSREEIEAKKSALALIRHGHKIPEDKRVALLRQLGEFFGKDKPTDADIAFAAKISLKTPEGVRQDANRRLIEKLGSVDDFAILWRKHFVRHAKPKFLPKEWEVERRMYC